MGRVKEQLLEENWIEDEQQKIIDKRHTVISMKYADLFNDEDISNSKGMYITTIDGTVHICRPDDIIELHELHIKYQDDDVMVVIPLDKIAFVKYLQ